MAYCSALADALVYAPQLGTLATTTTPTAAQATIVWGQQFAQIKAALRRAGLSTTITASTGAEARAQEAEALLTSGSVLLAKGSVGRDAVSTAHRLLERGEAILAEWATTAGRMAMVDLGATIDAGTASPLWGSRWNEAADPNYDETAGTGNEGYAPVPAIEDGADL